MQEILNRIYKTRKQRGITQKEICEKIGISPSAFDNWKKGKNESLKKYLPQIGEILGVSVDYLLTGKESPAEEFYAKFLAAPEHIQRGIKAILQMN